MKLWRALGRAPRRESTPRAARKGRRWRGQSLAELALTLPILVLLLAVVVDGGLAFNSYERITSAARDGTRFALDAGRDGDTSALVLSKLSGLNTNNVDIYIIRGSTDKFGNISSVGGAMCNGTLCWNVTYHYGGNPNPPKLQPITIQTRLRSTGGTTYQNVPFTIVEVDYQHATFLGSFLNLQYIPMTTYAIVQQYNQ